LPDSYSKYVNTGLNKAGDASFKCELQKLYNLATSINETVDSLLGLGKNTLECYRDGVLKFAGIILTKNIELTGLSAIVEVKALGWMWLLSRRYAGLTVEVTYTDTDAGDIAWDLIDTTQALYAGSFGIIQGTIQTSLNRTITYQRKVIKEAIEDLSNTAFGFDFEITPAKVFNVYYPSKGSDKTSSVRFYYPSRLVKSIEESSDATKITNHVISTGNGFGQEELVVEVDDLTNQDTFKRLEYVYPLKDLSNAVVLEDVANQYITENRNVNPVFTLNIHGNGDSPTLDKYDVGDTCKLIIKEDYYHIDLPVRIFEIRVSILDNGQEDINLVVGLI
jgi:hypothetical protein